MEYYIYLTTNIINGKQYIGQHKGDINDSYFGSGINITKALKKYGKENFKKEILKLCESREEADIWERYYINFYNAIEDENFYNLQEGGTGGDGWRACQKWLLNNPDKAKKIYEKNIENLKRWKENNPEKYQELVLKPLREGCIQWRKNNPEKVAENIKKLNKGKEEWQKNHPEEHQKQIDAWRKAGSEANSQKIICITTGEIFESQSAAARAYNIPQTNISKCINGLRKSAGKHPITKEKMVWEKI